MNALRKEISEQPATVTLPERPINISVIQIHHGVTKHGNVNSKLPAKADGRCFFIPAPRMVHSSETLEAIKEVATRCAPWVRVITGPRLWSWNKEGRDESAFGRVRVVNGRLAHEHGGVAWSSDDDKGNELIMVGTFGGTAKIVGCVHHEVWHAVEFHLSSQDFHFVSATVEHGASRPGFYLASSVERRARCYQAYACARDENWRPLSVMGIPMSRIDRIFEYVYNGGLARDVTAGRPVVTRMLPGHRAARAVVRELGWQGIGVVAMAAMFLLQHRGF
jgi:hypothetical protein